MKQVCTYHDQIHDRHVVYLIDIICRILTGHTMPDDLLKIVCNQYYKKVCNIHNITSVSSSFSRQFFRIKNTQCIVSKT